MTAATGGWQEHVDRARSAGAVGDLLVLAGEAPDEPARIEAWIDAAALLRGAGQYDFALEWLARALALDAGHPRGIAEQALCRQREALPGQVRATPRQVLLFSGHMVDAACRPTPRFPSDRVPAAAARIGAALAALRAGAEDIALTQGACGGDLLFAEACRLRGVPVHWLQPLREAAFIDASVTRCGADWYGRYLAAKAALAAPPREAPLALGPLPAGRDENYAFERCNLWLLYTALAHGPERVRLICLWNGGGSDGPGGTAHMVEEVKRRAGRVDWIDTRTL